MSLRLFDRAHIKYLCFKYGFIPSRRYGQNFLINPEPIEAMVEAVAVSKSDTVIEVGPGFGALTLALAEKAGRVVAFEIEKKLEKYWDEVLLHRPNISLYWGNVLKIFNIKYSILNISEYKVIANLPYHITSSVIRMFLEAENPPEMMALMVQKEVAERICAKPGAMSALSVSVQYYAKPEIVMPVPRSYFWPEPEVDSAIIKIKIQKSKCKIKESDGIFFKIVKTGFASRRKLLIKNLLPLLGNDKARLKKIFAEVGLDEKARAQELSVEEWKRLAELFGALEFH